MAYLSTAHQLIEELVSYQGLYYIHISLKIVSKDSFSLCIELRYRKIKYWFHLTKNNPKKSREVDFQTAV